MAQPDAVGLVLSGWRSWSMHSARTGIGTAASLAAARLLSMPEAYWAPITTIIVMQSTLGAAWDVSKPRVIGTALGAALGGLLASYLHPGVILLGVAIFALGLICAALRLDQSAYRFAGITLMIVHARGARKRARRHRCSPFLGGLVRNRGRPCPYRALAGA